MTTLSVLLTYLCYGAIHWYLAMVFPILYLCYVSVCLYHEKVLSREKEEEESGPSKLFDEDLAHSQTKAEAIGEEIVRREGNESFVRYTSIDTDSFIESHVQEPAKPKVYAVSTGMALAIKNRIFRHAVNVAVKIAKADDEEEEEKGIIGKIFYYVIALPWNILRNISIPPSTEENWSRARACLFPLPAFGLICLFFEIRFEGNYWFLLLAIIPALIALSLLIYCTTHRSRAPSYLLAFTFASFLISIIWIWGLANLLVDLMEIIGIVADLPLEFLALTFLAFGNSMPDIATGIAISKMGLSEMALTGAISEPLFSIEQF